VGKPLRRELAGIWSARRGSYRVLDEIDEEKLRVVVLRIGPPCRHLPALTFIQ
jgi:mRNA interferase RelE/StbE